MKRKILVTLVLGFVAMAVMASGCSHKAFEKKSYMRNPHMIGEEGDTIDPKYKLEPFKLDYEYKRNIISSSDKNRVLGTFSYILTQKDDNNLEITCSVSCSGNYIRSFKNVRSGIWFTDDSRTIVALKQLVNTPIIYDGQTKVYKAIIPLGDYKKVRYFLKCRFYS